MSTENNLPLMPENVEQGNPPEATIEARSDGLSSKGLSRESSISSHLDFRSVSVPSEERKEPSVPGSIPSPLSFENQRGGEGSRRSISGLVWHEGGARFNPFPDSLIDEQDKVPSEKLEDLPRLVDRNRAFHQSSNKVHLRHNQGLNIYRLLRFNWFHVLLRWPARYSFSVLMSVWTGVILAFAGIYVWHDTVHRGGQCVLGGVNGEVISLGGAFAFSLQTCSSGGYTLPNYTNSFFEKECTALQTIIYFQMAWSLIFNAFLLTFVYNRLGRSETRSVQVIFSNKALVSVVDGQVRFQVRLFDCDSRHPVVEAHIRMYAVMKQRPVPRPLRTLQPDDQLGGMLFLSFPTVVSHHIDLYSLLHPPVMTVLLKPNGLALRQVDGFTLNRSDIICPICGESYGTFARWQSHVRYMQIGERLQTPPPIHQHLSLDLQEIERETHTKPIEDLDVLKQFFKENVSEILCLVEGIDPIQSGSFQALQSYRFDDIEWEKYAQFAPCLSIESSGWNPSSKDRIFSVDLDRYHNIVGDPEAANAGMREDDEGRLKVVPPSTTLWRSQPRAVPQNRLTVKSLSSRISDSFFEDTADPRDVARPWRPMFGRPSTTTTTMGT